MNFFKRVLSTITGIILFCMLCFFGLMILGAIVGSSGEEEVVVKKNSVLALKLDEPIADYAGQFDYDGFMKGFYEQNKKYNGLFNIIDAIEAAADDDDIKGITIKNNMISAGMAQTKAIRDALVKFKESGKFILAYGEIFTQKDYYLNSVADTIYLNPVGGMEFKGLSSEIMYYKDFQDKYGVKMEVIRHGKYKSAVEKYLRQDMSEANREQITAFLESIWTEMKDEIAVSRAISAAELDTIADNLLGRTPKKALAVKLIDRIAYEDEFDAAVRNALALEEDKKINTIDIDDYAEKTYKALKDKEAANEIAVIYAQGQIIYGQGDEANIGQGEINKALKKAREDDDVKAIVLRVNSPGGSALASELIWREIERTKKEKPVVVSMGNLAASGGYYIACNADKIIAEPNTITGSIGVYGTLPNMHELANNMGINAEQVTTNKNAVSYSLFEPMSEEQRALIKEGIEDVYDTFITRVADGRKMEKAEVDSIAQGRVWSGRDAIKIGLVDEIGGMEEALIAAAGLADIDNYQLQYLPVYKKDFNQILNSFSLIQSKEDMIKEEIGEESYMIMQQLKKVTQQKGIQLMLPYDITIQ